ncbi:MAG TPA: hypothetical protein VFI03_11630 [Solirubrobacterales bacterium]|nr:hypothetical protein [Solirubrobacterales bacterium]
MRNALKIFLLVLLTAFSSGAGAMAADPEPPLFDGSMTFAAIDGPEDPEEYSWTVQLADNQELKLIDDQHAQVIYDDGVHVAFTINAEAAHDAIGTSVPTSINVSEGDIVTLTVHHRAGNPAAGGAPFDYPIMGGAGWEGGLQTHVVLGPPDEQQLREERERRLREEAEAARRQQRLEGCRVPRLMDGRLAGARKRLTGAGCALGKVRGEKSKTSRVVKQYVAAGTVLPAGAKVSIKLG